MPGNLLFADKTFPVVSGNTESDLKAILNYMYMLQEQLRYTLGNIGTENINLDDITIKADNVDFEGYTLSVDSLASTEDSLHTARIAMQAGFDFANAAYMPFTDSRNYTSLNRALNGVHSISFCGDTVLSATGGDIGNAPTQQTGLIRNKQSGTTTVVQAGIEIVSSRKLEIVAQTDGSTGAAVELHSRDFASCAEGAYVYRLLVSDSGIQASKFRKISGVMTAISSTTIWS